MSKDIFGGGKSVEEVWVALGLPSTDHNECRLLVYPASRAMWLNSTVLFNTNRDDLDDECQVIHCVSFVDP